MTLSAPMQFDKRDGRDQASEATPATPATPATATSPGTAPARPQPQPQAAARHLMTTAEQQAVAPSWGRIVLATLALWSGLGLWTIIAVSGDYIRWLLCVAVLGIILVLGLSRLGWARLRGSLSTDDHARW